MQATGNFLVTRWPLNMNKVEIYTSNFCPYCVAAKRLLDKHDVEYTEIDMAMNHEGRAELAARTGLSTFPQIVVDGEPLGGYDQLKESIKSGRFKELFGTT